ncbi:MAG: NAD-binding protein [Patescibacteria group bacterium]
MSFEIRVISQKISCLYEDVEDGDVFEKVNLKKIKLVVSSIRNPDISLSIIRQVRNLNKKCIIIVVSERAEDAIECYEAGASHVVVPNELGGHHITTLIEQHGLDINKFIPIQIKHLEQLNQI